MECFNRINGSSYTIGNKYIERTWIYSNHKLQTISISDRINGRQWCSAENSASAEFCYEGLTCSYRDRQVIYDMELINVDVNEITDSIYSSDGLEMVFNLKDKLHGVDIRWHAIVYEGAPAIRTYIEVKSYNLPMGEFYDRMRFNVLDSYALSTVGGKLASYEFFTRTDLTNDLVKEKTNPAGFDKGNLLLYNAPEGGGFFILKESPCFSDERPETEGSFHIDGHMIQTLGWGIRPEEISQTAFLKTYGSVIGFFNGDSCNGYISLKKYQTCRAGIKAADNCVVMVNPWGDRMCYEHMGEDFIIRELKAASELGVTHYQLDDGWQKGKGLIQLVDNEAVGEDYWEIDTQRFPNSFDKIAQASKKLGVELALWFAPDFNKLFRNYQEQEHILFDMYKKYGIKRFKIDAVKLRTKEAEDNLEHLLDELRRKTNGDISFNLDTTADPRAGYFMFQEYGNIFLENRYTDWGNYYPWLTLKNLWDLCAFVPSQRLQAEFLNLKRCKDKYASSDRLAPEHYSYEYVFAITMFANPLCWFETSALDEESQKKYSDIISFYRKHQEAIYNGCILPVGDRPSGYSWTGFISHDTERNAGYLLVFREYNEERQHFFDIPFLKGNRVELKCIYGNIDIPPVIDGNGNVGISIEAQNDFRLYTYKVTA